MSTKKAPSWQIFIKTKERPDPNPLDRKVGSMADYYDARYYHSDATLTFDDFYRGRSVTAPYGYEGMEPFEFVATLTFDDFYRGRSAAGFVLLGEKGEWFAIKIGELSKMLKLATVKGGKVSGRWGFVKQGQNYSLSWKGPK